MHAYDHTDSATNFGEEAAAAVGVDRDRIFKTLVVDAGGELVVAVVPVARQLDLKALAGAAGAKKAALAEPAAAARSSGYVVGGISPLGQRTRLRTFVDRSAEDFETIFVSAGKRGLQVELAVGDLLRLTRGDVYAWCMTRTNIDIDDDLIQTVMKQNRLSTKKDAVEFALRKVDTAHSNHRARFAVWRASAFPSPMTRSRSPTAGRGSDIPGRHLGMGRVLPRPGNTVQSTVRPAHRLDPGQILACPPVRMELAVDPDDLRRQRLLKVYDGFPTTDVVADDFDLAAEIYRATQRHGYTVRSQARLCDRRNRPPL